MKPKGFSNHVKCQLAYQTKKNLESHDEVLKNTSIRITYPLIPEAIPGTFAPKQNNNTPVLMPAFCNYLRILPSKSFISRIGTAVVNSPDTRH